MGTNTREDDERREGEAVGEVEEEGEEMAPMDVAETEEEARKTKDGEREWALKRGEEAEDEGDGATETGRRCGWAWYSIRSWQKTFHCVRVCVWLDG